MLIKVVALLIMPDGATAADLERNQAPDLERESGQ